MARRRTPLVRKTNAALGSVSADDGGPVFVQQELLAIFRHEARHIVENLTLILSLIAASCSRPEKIRALVADAETNLQSLAQMLTSLHETASIEVGRAPLLKKENLRDLMAGTVEMLGWAARGVEFRLNKGRAIYCTCDRALIQFLLTSTLIFLHRALQAHRRSRSILGIALTDEGSVAKVEFAVHLDADWPGKHLANDDRSWTIVAYVAECCGGLIEPQDYILLRDKLTLTLPKTQRDQST